jgi:hypothetical protein
MESITFVLVLCIIYIGIRVQGHGNYSSDTVHSVKPVEMSEFV